MKNQDREIRNQILKAINEHKSEIVRYEKMLTLVIDSGKIERDLDVDALSPTPKKSGKHGGTRPNSGRKKIHIYKQGKLDEILSVPQSSSKKYKSLKRKKNKPKYRNNLNPIRWDKLVLPLLKKTKKSMTAPNIINELFKYKKQKNKSVFKDRLYSGLGYLRNKGLIESSVINGKTHYKLPKKDVKVKVNVNKVDNVEVVTIYENDLRKK